jgi:tRNA threonylcarbamoyladenosine biosynthesis protein TsaE
LVLTTRSADETQQLGRLLGALTRVSDVFLLQGTLGAGKTTLTQGVAWGAGVEGYAHSPTFVIVHEYAGRIPIYHLDLYRIGDALEAEDLAIDEMLERGACLVEWPERAPGVFPGEHLLIAIEFGDNPDARHITLTPVGERYVRITDSLQSTAPAPTGTN